MRHLVMSEGGNDFLDMILDWDVSRKVMKEEDDRFVKAKMLVDGHDFIFFFVCRHNVYGANENARGVFSVMKKPMDEPGYDEMSFSATNLTSAMKGEPKEEIFIYKDIDSIKVLNKEVARHMLMKQRQVGKKDQSEVAEKMRNIQAYRQDGEDGSKSKDGRIKFNKDFESTNYRNDASVPKDIEDVADLRIHHDRVLDGDTDLQDVAELMARTAVRLSKINSSSASRNMDDNEGLLINSVASRWADAAWKLRSYQKTFSEKEVRTAILAAYKETLRVLKKDVNEEAKKWLAAVNDVIPNLLRSL